METSKFAGLRKWSLAVIGVCAVLVLSLVHAYHGIPDFDISIGAVITLTSTGTLVQGFLDWLSSKKGA